MTFADDLDRERAARRPRMALRRFAAEFGGLMDDVVMEDVTMFRAEQMADDHLWLCCYLRNSERITFHVSAVSTGSRKGRPARLDYDVFEMPDEWVDIDAERNAGEGETGR